MKYIDIVYTINRAVVAQWLATGWPTVFKTQYGQEFLVCHIVQPSAGVMVNAVKSFVKITEYSSHIISLIQSH
jgi:hypothetical protein